MPVAIAVGLAIAAAFVAALMYDTKAVAALVEGIGRVERGGLDAVGAQLDDLVAQRGTEQDRVVRDHILRGHRAMVRLEQLRDRLLDLLGDGGHQVQVLQTSRTKLI